MRDLFIEIAGSIKRNKLRTCLTGFAVAWGIFMLIVLLGAGNGVMNAFLRDSGNVNVHNMTVYPQYTSKAYDGLPEGRFMKMDDRDVKLTESKAFSDIIDSVQPQLSQGGMKMTYGKRYFSVRLKGAYPEEARRESIQFAAGRFLNDNDIKGNRKVAVITHLQAKNFLEGRTDYSSIIGKTIKIDGLVYKVIGVRKAAENQNDDEIYVPFTTLKKIYGKKDIDYISFKFHGLETEEDNIAFENLYKRSLNQIHRAAPDDNATFYLSNSVRQAMQMDKGTSILENALWIVGLLTLLSGVVGVSNIMLITVKERTHEFGIRKAIGARPWDITKLILAESVTITAIFGYLGMFLGMAACQYLDYKYGHATVDIFGQAISVMKNPTVGIGVALRSTVVMIVSGMIAGMIPARKAAKVRPIEALRAD